jgi:3-isopropylmalate/(R)-2-methylmalate dehydratase small subunit
MPILVCEKADEINAGDELDVDLKNGVIKDITSGKTFSCEKFPAFMEEIVEAKGLLNWIKHRR